ncbi:MAG TPA: hypothetical protein PLS53_16915, partial [Thermoanaerobaculaceae bacterium]|nr:hypothetical protein [Thermoanaerobaculaceae bacterium]
KTFSSEFPSVSTPNARLTVEVISGTGKVIAFGSGVANGSQDPATFEMAFRDELLADNVSGGSITAVAAGAGLTGGGTSGAVTLDVGAGAGIAVDASTVAIADNGVTTAKLANGAVTAAKVGTSGGSNGQVLTVTAGGAAWQAASGGGDITGVVAGTGLSGGGTSGDVTLGIANGGVGTTQLANAAVVSAKLGPPLSISSSGSATVLAAENKGSGAAVAGTATNGIGVGGSASSGGGTGVLGITAGASGYGVVGRNTTSNNFGYLGGASYSVYGETTTDTAVRGKATSGTGVSGVSSAGDGVRGESSNTGVLGLTNSRSLGAFGVIGKNTVTGAYAALGVDDTGIVAKSASGGDAGAFNGTVEVFGTFFASGTKSFRIDHPLDPARRYLVHAAAESSEVLNIYSGNVVLDARGEAVVVLPAWFEAVNRDVRYVLTPIGAFAPLYVAEKVANGHFRIAGGTPGMEVSWQLTALRSDPWMLAHPMEVEPEKSPTERGYYVNPEEYGASNDHHIAHTRGFDRVP